MSMFEEKMDELRAAHLTALDDSRQERVREITEDIKEVFNDESVFGELLSGAVSEALGPAFEGMEHILSEAIGKALTDPLLASELAEELNDKDVERQEPSYDKLTEF